MKFYEMIMEYQIANEDNHIIEERNVDHFYADEKQIEEFAAYLSSGVNADGSNITAFNLRELTAQEFIEIKKSELFDKIVANSYITLEENEIKVAKAADDLTDAALRLDRFVRDYNAYSILLHMGVDLTNITFKELKAEIDRLYDGNSHDSDNLEFKPTLVQ